jgi:hypothetical protein
VAKAEKQTHLHWIVWACEARTDQGFSGVTKIDVVAGSMGEAIERAKMLVPGRPHYWLNDVVEHHDHGNTRR